jgi:hypothetical protein
MDNMSSAPPRRLLLDEYEKIEQLRVPVVGAQRPPVVENDRLGE